MIALAAAALATASPAGAAQQGGPLVPGAVGIASYIDPASHLFGDTVTARLELLVDPAKVDPGSIRVRASFRPYRLAGPPAATRGEAGGVVTLRYHWRLLCLREVCRPRPGAARTFRFPVAGATFRRLDGTTDEVTRRWYPLTVASRLSSDTALRADLVARAYPLPKVEYRVDPNLLSTLLFALASCVGLTGVFLVGRTALSAGRAPLRRRLLRRLGPIRRELALVRDAAARNDPDATRKALDGLAVALGGDGTDDLARGARRLAWSPNAPDSEDALELADEVVHRLEGVRR